MQRADELNKVVQQLKDQVSIAEDVEVTLQDIVSCCDTLRNLIDCIAAIPNNESSSHQQLRTDAIQLRSQVEEPSLFVVVAQTNQPTSKS